MKWKYLLGILFAGLYSCSPEYMSFRGSNCIQFNTATNEVYTFAYFPESKQRDTLNIQIVTVGEITDYPREIKFEQVTKEWKYSYDAVDTTKIVDSVLINMEYPAESGVHFESLGENNTLVLPANQNVLNLKVVVLRGDDDLKKHAHKLTLSLLPSEDFALGEIGKLSKTIIISDKLERPTRWKESSYEVQTYLGAWSETKHRLLIDVTGQKWDNDFLYYILYDFNATLELEYYLAKTKKALDEYNSNPANNPPLKDEFGKDVVFP